ncbi:MAG TPA: hypothetical protein VFL13_09945 [Candidatus Baltobacteraceae bacterium]|nr:hypothetical protein [Candidatus Baltobacteraceae bacterium]
MKMLLLLALLAAGAALIAARKGTPFLRWGIVVAVAGVLLISSAAIFTARGVMYGTVLVAIGLVIYGYGRVFRNERLSLRR